jgi:hypothetical protein
LNNEKVEIFEVLMAAGMNKAVFWVVAPCSLVKFIYVSEVLVASIIRAMSKLLPDCMVQQSRRWPSSMKKFHVIGSMLNRNKSQNQYVLTRDNG